MRLDLALVSRGLARSRSHARQLIDAGTVSVAKVTVPKPSTAVDAEVAIEVHSDPYVSRGAHKLIHALDESGVQVPPRVLDAGASTGGFTQVLLERGATTVYAVDVGHGQLSPVVREDPRVIVREGFNLRYLTLDDLDGRHVDMVSADLSFISLTLVLESLFAVVTPEGCVLCLVKPQFEVGRAHLGSHGIVKDERVRADAVRAVVDHAGQRGWSLTWSGEARPRGAGGNQETFCLFHHTGSGEQSVNPG